MDDAAGAQSSAMTSRKNEKAGASGTALLVANAAAQSGRNAERIARARELLDRAGLAHHFLPTEPEGRTSAAVCDALETKRYSRAIAMGGDGTISDVARGLLASGLASEIALGILPTGTANDVGHSFGLESSAQALERNVEVIRAGHETGFDVSRLTAMDEEGRELRTELFVDSAGWGLGPKALRMRNEERRLVESIPVVRHLYRDHLVYASAALKAFAESYLSETKFDVDVVADGKKRRWKGLTDLVVKSPRIYAGLWVFDPTSRHDDGLVEVMPFAGRRDWLSKALLFLDHSGALAQDAQEVGLEHAQMIRASRLELTFRPRAGGGSVAAQVDGEEFQQMSRVRIEVLKRALRLIVPERQA